MSYCCLLKNLAGGTLKILTAKKHEHQNARFFKFELFYVLQKIHEYPTDSVEF